ncbi:AAA domain-containing protein [Moheibacter stercoris]|uniref:Superfamily I DNA and/or RNA helicase n=1 Tax=Moheibacter stercoris TaxID=1628251 RepID=A0ABV2LWN1_9FLAO
MNQLTPEIFNALQTKLKVGNRRGIHLNAIPGNSRYKFDLARLSAIFDSLPERFILDLLTLRNVNFKFSIHDKSDSAKEVSNSRDSIYLNKYDEEEEVEETNFQSKKDELLFKLGRSLENLIFQNEVIESEKGVNSLGFGFPILFRKDVSDGQISASPILIWSVKIKPSPEMNTWEISRTEDDPIYLNEVLINHLQSDSGVILDPIPERMLEDGKIDKPELLSICQNILSKLKIEQNLDFLLNNYEPIPAIKTKAAYDQLLKNKGDGIIEKAGIFSLFEVQKQNIINDYETLKKEFKSIVQPDHKNFQSITAIEADPSQQGILESLKSQSKILIQGPPGTGKSQTLTALLINSLENKQKTIVVCEKQTALEVLHNALHKQGYGKYSVMIKDSVADRKLVVDAVRKTIDEVGFKKAIDPYPESVIQEQLSNIQASKQTINSIHQILNEDLISEHNWTEIIGQILKNTEDATPMEIQNIRFEFSDSEWKGIQNLLENGEELYGKFQPLEENALFHPQTLIRNSLFETRLKVDESFQMYERSWNEIQQLKSEFEVFYQSKRREEFLQQLEEINQLINQSEVLTSTLSADSEVYQDQTDSFWFKILALFSSSKNKAKETRKSLQIIGAKMKEFSLHSNFTPISISSDLHQNQDEIRNYRTQLEIAKQRFSDKLNEDFQNLDLLNHFEAKFSNATSDKIANSVRSLKNSIQLDKWLNNSDFGMSFQEFESRMNSVFKQFHSYKSNPEDPFQIEYNWYQFLSNQSDLNQKLIENLKPISNWKASLLSAYFQEVLKRKTTEKIDFNEDEYASFLKKIIYFSSSQKNFIQNYWDIEQRNAVKKFETENKDLTVANLYNKRRSEKHNRLSLRQISMKDLDLFTSFFPIILTTPDAASNLFQGRNFYFDNVVFDEASQLKLEDNLPAMLKGKNVIIAGDEHQMPPSNYFSRVFDGSLEDEDDAEEESEAVTAKNAMLNIESLLDYAVEYQFDKNHLDFHYRSRHPYLIDFSNHAFYQARLKPLPSLSDVKPIEFFEAGGTFHDHINEEEADKILEILESIEPKSDGTYPSVGIATFNITQRNFIKRKIIQRENEPENETFSEKMRGLEAAGFFIKNLENIQGDERDIIILSTTYGKKRDGKFIQSFGPINHSKGYKLLNVIVTRAKEKIYVCNSIPTEFYSTYKEALKLEGSNNRRAVFYAYLAYAKAVHEGNEEARREVLETLDQIANRSEIQYETTESIFVDELFKRMRTEFPEEELYKNYRFGGYSIDILVKRKNNPIAIECMSKSIYESELGYLEDLHKEKILRNSGFEYVRIWSQNVWQNLDAELYKIKRIL